jgi:nucleoside-diphosphate-sugar epimerase
VPSRWPITDRAARRLPGDDTAADEGRTVLFARVPAPTGPVPFFTTHLSAAIGQSAVRRRQVEALCRFVAGHARSVRLVGDRPLPRTTPGSWPSCTPSPAMPSTTRGMERGGRMKVFVAGSTGTIGVPLLRALVAGGHRVYGLTRRPSNGPLLTSLGAEAVVADAMDRDALLAAVDGLTADAVIHQLTALKRPPARHRDMAQTDALRTRGTAHLLEAARMIGAHRFVTQSMIFGYGYGDWGDRLLSERDRFGPPGRGRFEQHVAAMRSAEQQTFTTDGVQGVALRYGLFYGPAGAIEGLIERLRRRRLPIPRDGGGTMSWTYVDDAAAATVAALERGRAGQAYNVVDDEPVRWREFLDVLAQAIGAPPPRTMPGWLFGLAPYAAAMMTSTLRVSNAKAKADLGWEPRVPTYREGIARIADTITTRSP